MALNTTYITNVPRNTSMQNFYSLYSKYGELAKSSRFIVRFTPPLAMLGDEPVPAEDLMYLCESAELPGRGFMSADIRYYGPNFKSPYQSTYEDINLTFLCRDQFEERRFFDNWMNVINPVNSYDFEYRDNYITNIEIYQMSDVDIGNTQGSSPTSSVQERGQGRYKFTLAGAYPVLVNPQPVTWADDNFHRITVTFTYSRWYKNDDETANSEGDTLVGDGSQIVTENGTKLPYVL